MNIIIEDSSKLLKNLGDAAMLMVCVRRLKHLYPHATLVNISYDLPGLARYIPECQGVPADWRTNLLKSRPFLGKIPGWIPGNRPGSGFRNPRATLRLSALRKQLGSRDLPDHIKFLDLMAHADLLVASGGGYLTNIFQPSHEKLPTFELAARLSTPFGFFGQGIGPFSDHEFEERTRSVLARAQFIGLREKRFSPAYCPPHTGRNAPRITGDDAVELGYQWRSEQPGESIGLNFRLAPYSGVEADGLEKIRDTLLRILALSPEDRFLPLPISHYDHSNDFRAAVEVVGESRVEPYPSPDDIDFEAFRTNLSRCRLVVTGSYHAMVFALSAGIPAVGLYASPYYQRKFEGLVDCFGAGASAVDLRTVHCPETLYACAAENHARADELRPRLLEAARWQIAEGEKLYTEVAARFRPAAGSARTEAVPATAANR